MAAALAPFGPLGRSAKSPIENQFENQCSLLSSFWAQSLGSEEPGDEHESGFRVAALCQEKTR